MPLSLGKAHPPGFGRLPFAFSCDGTAGSSEGTGAAAQFNLPAGMACDGSGTVYVADRNNHRIRVIK